MDYTISEAHKYLINNYSIYVSNSMLTKLCRDGILAGAVKRTIWFIPKEALDIYGNKKYKERLGL